ASASSASRSSWSKTNVLNVTNPFTPRACNVCITSESSASPKPTLALAVKCLSPKYTASAPALMAVLSCGQYPAGLISSGLFQTRFIGPIHGECVYSVRATHSTLPQSVAAQTALHQSTSRERRRGLSRTPVAWASHRAVYYG